ncbi:MAG TPA: DinB family protein [Anaerolineales bacterium]
MCAIAETSDHLAERLRSEGEKTLSFFRDLAPEQWDRTIYTEGAQWSLRQVLAHFVVSEASMTRLVENILAGGTGSPEDFRLNEYNERHVARLQDLPVETLLQQYNQNRQASMALAARLSPADLARTGRHPFLGVAPVSEILKMMYRHNQIHQREIRKVLE